MLARRIAIAFVAGLALLASLPSQSHAALGTPRVVASGLDVPWGIAFLPNGDALVSERGSGRIKRIARGGHSARTVKTVRGAVRDFGEGGLLGIAVSPTYSRDHYVYAYYTSSKDNRVVRFRLSGGPTHVVVRGIERAGNHDGGRLAFGPDGDLYISTGDARNGSNAQDRSSLNGKILRVRPNGAVPSDNPFSGSPIWTLGHRNVEGLAFDSSGRLWATEFGENTTDEVNLIVKGRNYGWPEVEGQGDAGGRFTNPVVTWPVADASPSGAAIVGSTLYVGALRGQRLWQIPLHGTGTGEPRAAFQERYGRIRTVVRVPGSRAIWITTSNRDGYGSPRSGDDRILRIPIS